MKYIYTFALILFCQLADSRPLSQAEKDFYIKAASCAKSSLPPVPSAWKVTGEIEPDIPEVSSDPESPRTHLSWNLEKAERKEKEAQIHNKNMKILEKHVEDDKVPQAIDALLDKNDKLMMELEAPSTAKDTKKADQILAELNKNNAELAKLQSSMAMPAAETKTILAGTKASIDFDINLEMYMIADEEGKQLTPPPGVAYAFRIERQDKSSSEAEGSTILFVGPWERTKGDPAVSALHPPGKPITKIHSFIISIRGEPKIAEELMKGIKIDELKKCL